MVIHSKYTVFHGVLRPALLPRELEKQPGTEGAGKSSIPCVIFCAAAAAKSLQLCPTLCDPIEGSPPGSPVFLSTQF